MTIKDTWKNKLKMFVERRLEVSGCKILLEIWHAEHSVMIAGHCCCSDSFLVELMKPTGFTSCYNCHDSHIEVWGKIMDVAKF